MRSVAFAVVVLVAGCHLRAGFDAATRTRGPLQSVMTRSSVSRTTGVIDLPPVSGRNYELEAGFGTSRFTVNGLIAAHDVTAASFTPGAGYLATTFGANVRWSVTRWYGLTPTVVAGPARMLLLDRSSGDQAWGNALRLGGGVQYQLGPVAIYGDLYHQVVAFGDGAATGTTTLDGITLGLSLQP